LDADLAAPPLISYLPLSRALALTPIFNQRSAMRTHFDHEKLEVYQCSIEFITWSTDLLSQLRQKQR
jgi:hypothetical protein